MLRRPVELSRQTFEVVWERLNLGDIHPTLMRGALFYAPEERPRLAAHTDRELAGRRLTRSGRLDDDFTETLHTLQRPDVDYYTWVKSGRGESTVRVAAKGRNAVSVVALGHTLHIASCAAESLAREFTALLPSAPAARLASLTCSDTDLNAIQRGQIPSTTSPSIRDAKHVLRWLGTPYTYFGRLYVAIRDSRGKRRRNENPPGWADTNQGRILFGVDKTGWISLSGAGPHEVAATMQRLEHKLRSDP